MKDDGTYAVSGYEGEATEAVILSTYKGKSVTSIGNRAFMECSELTSVTIPDSVTNIGKNAFFRCVNLTSVEIPDSVTDIGESAFESCTRLENITVPDGVTTIGARAFEGCSLKSLSLPRSVTGIEVEALQDCEKLTEINYDGTIDEWYSIVKDDSMDYLSGCSIKCTDGVIESATVEEGTDEDTTLPE